MHKRVGYIMLFCINRLTFYDQREVYDVSKGLMCVTCECRTVPLKTHYLLTERQ